MFHSAPVGILLTTLHEWCVLEANDAFLALTGYARDEVIGRTMLELHFWRNAAHPATFIYSTSNQGTARNLEQHFLTKDGRTRVGLFNVERLQVEDEACLLVMIQDITDRKQMEETLQATTVDLKHAQTVAQTGSWRLDVHRNELWWSDEAYRMFGIAPGTPLTYEMFLATVHPHDRAYVDEQWTAALHGAYYDIEHRILVDDAVKWVRERAELEFDAEGGLLGGFGSVQDITDRKRAEEMRFWLASFPELNPHPIVEVDLAGQIHYLNPAAKRLIPDLASMGQQHLWLSNLADIGQRLKDSEIQPLVREVTLDGVTYQQTLQYVASTQRVRIYAMDITSRRQAEAQREAALEALHHYAAELQVRNDDLIAFAHTVAHDLKNPLNVVVGYAEMLELEGGNTPVPPERLAAYIGEGARKMARIIDELLLLAGVRQADVNLSPLDMASIVDESRRRLADLVTTYQPEISLPVSWPEALGYAPWIEEVWVNYLSNAMKYGGCPPRLTLGGESLPGDMIHFWVRDNGRGITPAAQADLFKAFSAAAELRGTGHGVGLSIVRRIVEKLGGQVAAQNNSDGTGSTFSFTLPCANGKVT